MKSLSTETMLIMAGIRRFLYLSGVTFFGIIFGLSDADAQQRPERVLRQRILLDDDWCFFKYDSVSKPDRLIYDVCPEVTDRSDNKVADSKEIENILTMLKT